MFQNVSQSVKASYKFNDAKWRKVKLSCSKKNICVSKRNNIKVYGYFYCLNCLHSFGTKRKLESHSHVCENRILIMLPYLLKSLG